MILNLILLAIGAVSLIYGIKTKLKLYIFIGLFLICCGAVSFYVDCVTGGLAASFDPDARLPFVLDSMMK